MTSPLTRLALAALLAAAVPVLTPAHAQTALSDSQILQGLQGLSEKAPTITAQQLRTMVQTHMAQNPGEQLSRPSLALKLDQLPQINVQIQFRLGSAIIEPSSYGTLGAIADAMHNPILHGYKFLVTGNTDVTFTVPSGELARSLDVLEAARGDIGYASITHDTKVAKISVVGVGMRSHAGVAATMFSALAGRGINIQAITTSEIKVSVLIEEDYVELAVRVLHTAYGLDAEDGEAA